jgi:FkbM family methyltransferase
MGSRPDAEACAALSQLTAEFELFHCEPVAVAAESDRITFHESDLNVSGSLLADHVNVVRDSGSAYDVEALDLSDLARRIGADQIDILKLDLEGAEYDVLQGASDSMPKTIHSRSSWNSTIMRCRAIARRTHGGSSND